MDNTMTVDNLLNTTSPSVRLVAKKGRKKEEEISLEIKFAKTTVSSKGEGLLVMANPVPGSDEEIVTRVPCITVSVTSEEKEELLSGVINPTQYMQSIDIRTRLEEEFQKISNIILQGDNGKVSLAWGLTTTKTTVETVKSTDIDLYARIQNAFLSESNAPIPEEYRVKPDESFLPNDGVCKRIAMLMADRTPAIMLVGPSGSGKTNYARLIGQSYERFGYGTFVVDAQGHLDVDELMDHTDFNKDEGITVRKGSLTTAVEEMNRMGLKSVVIINEFPSLRDECRRAFYPLFDRYNRNYYIQHSKGETFKFGISFENTTFLLTANPNQTQYNVSDHAMLSNAEMRRIAMIPVPYETSLPEVKKILKSIVTNKASFKDGLLSDPTLETKVNWGLGAQAFINCNPGDDYVPYDVPYSTVAHALWLGTVFGSIPKADPDREMAEQFYAYVVEPIPDSHIRDFISTQLRNAGILIPGATKKKNR